MAKRKIGGGPTGDQVVHLHVGKGDGAPHEIDDEEIQALDALEDGQLLRAVEEVRQVEGAKAEVYRMAPPERQGHCRLYPVALFSLERVSTDYGPGKYRVRFKGPGDKYIKGGGTFDIAEALNSTGAAAPANTTIQEFVALMKERDAREAAARDKQKGDWLEWAKILAPLALPKILDMLGGGRGTGLPDMIRAVKDLRELQGPQAPPQDLKTQFGEVVAILQGAKELVGDDGGKQATGSTWVDLIRDLAGSPAAGALVHALSGSGPPRSVSPSAVPLAPGGSSAPVALLRSVPTSAAAPVTAAGSMPPAPLAAGTDVKLFEQLQWLRGTLDQLLVQAGKGSNPRLYAEVVLDNLPPIITEAELLERLAREDWLAQLAQLDTAVGQHSQWFEKFRDYLVKALRRKARRESDAAELPAAGPGPGPGPNEPMVEGDEFEQPH
jgi:hypothetical protein